MRCRLAVLPAFFLFALVSRARPAASQDTAPPSPSPAHPAGIASAAPAMLHPDSLPRASRVRLMTVGLQHGSGIVINAAAPRSIVGTLVRMDSIPGLSYVLRREGVEWSIPRSAVLSAERRVGRRSLRRGLARSALKGALAGTATAMLLAEEAGKGNRNYARRFPMHMGVGAVVAMAIGTQESRDVWEALSLPRDPTRP